jgi:hypothetical protein
VNAFPPARKEIEPASLLPFALLGVLKEQEATPTAAFAVPLSFAPATEAAHLTAAGRTGAPARLTRADATTIEPAFGFAGASRAALAVTAVEPPPPPPPPPPVDSFTTIVIRDELFARTGSACGAASIAAEKL